MRPKVLISVPTGDGWIHSTVVNALTAFVRDGRVDGALIMPQKIPYDNNMAHIVAYMLHEGFDYWVNVDADNAPTKNPLDLVEMDKDIIGCPTPIRRFVPEANRYELVHNVYRAKGDGYEPFKPPAEMGYAEVDAVGSGCMVVARRVLEAVKAPFMRKWRDDGTVELGCDMNFCRKAKAEGFQVWAHYGYMCSHVKQLDLLTLGGRGGS